MRTKSLSRAPAQGSNARVVRSSPASTTSRQYLFVYGTLKKGGRNHRQISRDHSIEFVGDARIRGELYELRGTHYPGAVHTASANKSVSGQLFIMRNPQRTLTALDKFEGVDEGLFRRELTDAWVHGKRAKAWVYFYDRRVDKEALLIKGSYS